MFIRQNTDLKAFATYLRNHATPQEKLLWNSYLKHYRPQINRQYIIGNYIVDFFCRKAKLAIEIDGMQHYTPPGMKYDEIRTDRIEEYDVVVIRVSNADVDRNLKNVCQYIDNTIKERIRFLTQK